MKLDLYVSHNYAQIDLFLSSPRPPPPFPPLMAYIRETCSIFSCLK